LTFFEISVLLKVELCRLSQFYLEIVIVTLHPFECVPQLNIFALLNFRLKDLSVALLSTFHLVFFVQFSRCSS